MIRMGGSKMSKSRGNLIAPAKYYESVGADALRLFHLFVGPPNEDFDWTDQTDQMIEGCHRFLGRVWRLGVGDVNQARIKERPPTPADLEMVKATHRLIDKVSTGFDRWSYNTAVAALMEFTNALYKYVQSSEGANASTVDSAVDTMLLLLAPMSPHMTAELWERRHGTDATIHHQSWPVADPDLAKVARGTMIVQIDGKMRDKFDVDADISEDDAVAAALARPKIQEHLNGTAPTKVVARPPKLINLVTR
jgi:leucyl-tRNA synthetase